MTIYQVLNDTYVDEEHPTTNYGSDTVAYVDSTVNKRKRTLLKFYLTIGRAAYAYLYVYLSSADAGLNRVHRAQRLGFAPYWDENTATWNNQVSIFSLHQAHQSVSNGQVGTWICWDITRMFNDVNGQGDFGIRVIDSLEGSGSFRAGYGTKEPPGSGVRAYIEAMPEIMPITSVKSTDAHEDTPNQNYGGNNYLYFRDCGTGENAFAFQEFDITNAPPVSQVIDVKLVLTSGTPSQPGRTGIFKRITSSWGEYTLTWNLQPSVTTVDQYIHSMGTYPLGGYYYDITDLYKAAKNAGNELGIRIESTGAIPDDYEYFSDDWGGREPRIRIKYSVVSEDCYVKTTGDDTLDGESWATAWATIHKGATTMPDDSTIHIEHGLYNSEPVNNKIAPTNMGSGGVRYQIHEVGGGNGAATVTVEQN